MDWNFNNERPIYLQMADKLTERIATGVYPSGSELPSVRDVAAEAAVNPNTAQRAFAELKTRGLVETKGTVGSTVTSDAELIGRLRDGLAEEVIATAAKRLYALSFSREEAEKKMTEFLRRNESENT